MKRSEGHTPADRMFHVLVIGGMALVACGEGDAKHPISDPAAADGSGEEAFSSETNAAVVDASADAAPDPSDASLIILSTYPPDSGQSDSPFFPIEGPR